MRTKLKKSLSILLALVMLVGLLPTVAFAANQVLSSSTGDKFGTNWSYTASSKTLTLDGYSGGDLFTLADDNSVINVTGTNTVTISESADKDIDGIKGNKGLVIKGNGTLTINVTCTCNDFRNEIKAINANLGSLTICESVTVNINVTSNNSDAETYGIYIP